jgi:DNA-binding NarL/FixJ family response regulator
MPMLLAAMDVTPVLVVDETPGLTQDLLLALRRRSGFQVLGPVPDEEAALDAIVEGAIEMVIVQLDRRDGRQIEIVSAIRNGSSARVLAATGHSATPSIELALVAGACGVLPTDLAPSNLAAAFRRALSGELVLPVDELPVLVDRVWESRARRLQGARLASLTERERQVLAALSDGETTSAIAVQLGISPATVQTHVKNILGKLGVHSKVEALGAAWRGGLAVGARSA